MQRSLRPTTACCRNRRRTVGPPSGSRYPTSDIFSLPCQFHLRTHKNVARDRPPKKNRTILVHGINDLMMTPVPVCEKSWLENPETGRDALWGSVVDVVENGSETHCDQKNHPIEWAGLWEFPVDSFRRFFYVEWDGCLMAKFIPTFFSRFMFGMGNRVTAHNVSIMGSTARQHGDTGYKQTTMVTLFSASGHLGVVPSASHGPFSVNGLCV